MRLILNGLHLFERAFVVSIYNQAILDGVSMEHFRLVYLSIFLILFSIILSHCSDGVDIEQVQIEEKLYTLR
jgi:hypothetical protein